ncbi:MAG: MotA/TolQ/ExbB proton channel family protein [Deltaproteobacteria bacterium]|nr:MotA/TolQ/ExbB proton channel family protein [Deltaproteobacteria bacterium]
MFDLFTVPLMVMEEALPTGGGAAGVDAPAAMLGSDSVSDLLLNSLHIGQTSLVVPLVLWLLISMSAVTWGIVITKFREIYNSKAQSDKFSAIFWSSRNFTQITAACNNLKACPVATVYLAGHHELQKVMETRDNRTATHGEFGDLENIERALKRAKAEELTRLEKGTTFLATTASAAPFIGLFGTVWGIMRAFMGLSQATSTSIQAVAPGISEALIATAVGLAAAIPAAMAYNYFMQQVRYLSREMDKFSAEFLNLAKRHFLG